uniref:Uncharacterized protein n=1 Tax=Rhizophora mucronata TaxID=61149 RepID=A0A2P2L6G9_RHIMU
MVVFLCWVFALIPVESITKWVSSFQRMHFVGDEHFLPLFFLSLFFIFIYFFCFS